MPDTVIQPTIPTIPVTPAVMAAFKAGRPVVLHEQNAVPGLANRFLSRRAAATAVSFPDAQRRFRGRSRVELTGNPIREEVAAVPPDRDRLAKEAQGELDLDPDRRTVLVFGGSQGAKALNVAMMEGLSELTTQVPHLTVTHQTGESDLPRVAEAYRRAGIVSEVVPFLYDMPVALWEADLVVARAGAMTVAELTACGKPAILIPLPTAIYDHQTQNAKVMEAAGAAVLLPQSALTGTLLVRTVASILGDHERLRAMGEASLSLRRIDAAEIIVRECYALMGGHHDVNQSVGAAGG